MQQLFCVTAFERKTQPRATAFPLGGRWVSGANPDEGTRFGIPFGEGSSCSEHLFRLSSVGTARGCSPASRALRPPEGRLHLGAVAFPLGGRWVSEANPEEGQEG